MYKGSAERYFPVRHILFLEIANLPMLAAKNKSAGKNRGHSTEAFRPISISPIIYKCL
jgi:hypothetical protein